jgi:hypothetical protein
MELVGFLLKALYMPQVEAQVEITVVLEAAVVLA